MDPVSIVEDTERTWFCPQTNGRTDRQTNGQGETSIPPFNFVERGIWECRHFEEIFGCTVQPVTKISSKWQHISFSLFCRQIPVPYQCSYSQNQQLATRVSEPPGLATRCAVVQLWAGAEVASPIQRAWHRSTWLPDLLTTLQNGQPLDYTSLSVTPTLHQRYDMLGFFYSYLEKVEKVIYIHFMKNSA